MCCCMSMYVAYGAGLNIVFVLSMYMAVSHVGITCIVLFVCFCLRLNVVVVVVCVVCGVLCVVVCVCV